MSSASRSKRFLRAHVSLVGFVAAAAVTGAVLFPAAAGAFTRGFQVYNLSSHPISFFGWDGTNFDSAPAHGHILQPGLGYDDFEETYYFGRSTFGWGDYQILGDHLEQIGVFRAKMDIADVSTVAAGCQTSVGICTPEGDLNFGEHTITLLDDPGTAHEIPAGQSQAQHDTLALLCDNNNAAACSFAADTREKVDSPDHPVGNALINNTDEEQDTDVTISDTVGATDSVDVGLKVGGKILGIVEAEVEAKYSHEWTREHTFEQRVTVHCQGHHKCWITGTVPLFRDTGTFSLTLGNTLWSLRDVYVDSPDPSGQGAFSVNEQALTEQEQASLPQAVIQTGTNGNDTLAGTNADDVINAKAGDDAVSGGPGNDNASGGPGTDVLAGGPGTDRISGGPGNDSISDGAGRNASKGTAAFDRGVGRATLRAGSGGDGRVGGRGRDRLLGGDGDDRIVDGVGPAVIDAGKGNNRIDVRGHQGRDVITCTGSKRNFVLAKRGDSVAPSCRGTVRFA
jgi:hypothetical protein